MRTPTLSPTISQVDGHVILAHLSLALKCYSSVHHKTHSSPVPKCLSPHRLQPSRNFRDSPGFLEFVPGPGMLRKLARKSPHPHNLPRKQPRKCSNYTMLWRTIFMHVTKVALVWWEKLRTVTGKGVDVNKLKQTSNAHCSCIVLFRFIKVWVKSV